MSVVDRLLGRKPGSGFQERTPKVHSGEEILAESGALNILLHYGKEIMLQNVPVSIHRGREVSWEEGEPDFAYMSLDFSFVSVFQRVQDPLHACGVDWHEMYPTKGLRMRAADNGNVELDVRIKRGWISLENYINGSLQAAEDWREFCEIIGKPEQRLSLLEKAVFVMDEIVKEGNRQYGTEVLVA